MSSRRRKTGGAASDYAFAGASDNGAISAAVRGCLPLRPAARHATRLSGVAQPTTTAVTASAAAADDDNVIVIVVVIIVVVMASTIVSSPISRSGPACRDASGAADATASAPA